MTKTTVTRLFIGSVVAVVAGLVLGFIAVMLAFTGGGFMMRGPDVVGVEPTPFAWSMIGLMVLAVLVVLAGSIGGLVSWIGALLNTAQLADKTWFVLLLLLGIWNFGVVAMVAYVLAGPDALAERGTRAAA